MDPTLLAFGTVSDLAAKADTSRPSIVRFATKLGFDGYTDLQSWIRDGVARQLSSPSQRIRRAAGNPSANRDALALALQQALNNLPADRLPDLAKPIATAPNVWIISGETSLAGAHALNSGLSMIRPAVQLVEEHSTGRNLSSAAPGDVAVVFDFARYRRHAITAAQALHDLGVTIVAVTDGPLSPLAAMTQLWCELTIPAVGPFDSSVPVVAVVELLVAEVVNILGDSARQRIDRLESLWQATGTFLNDAPRANQPTP